MSSAVDLKTKEEKDAELDRRIEALRKKNEALVKRYQEIEEDKKKAEQEGIAVTTPRKPRPHEPETDKRKTEKENFTVTVDLSKQTVDKRVVNDWKPGTPRGRKTSEESDGHRGGANDGGHRGGAMDSGRWSNDGSQRGGPSDSHSPPRRAGSGRMGRGGQRGGGGRQERREWEPRTPKDGEPGDTGGSGRRGGRRGRGRGGGGTGGGGGEGEAAEGGVGTPGGAPGGADRKSKEWEEKRRQNIEKMNEEMEQIAEYEKGQRPDGDKPLRNFLDDPRRSGPAPDMDRKEGSRRHVRNWGGLDFDNVKTRAELEKEWTSRRPGPKGSTDMTMSMTGRERAEYLSWKKEREQIDEDRLARHRNATGQWRREWDAQKTENMFKEDQYVSSEGTALEQPSRRDDNKRPPKTPTFGDFLSQGRSPGQRGEQGGGRGRGPRPTYSMHDNRWEGDKEEEKKEDDDDKTKREKTKKKKKEEKAKPSTVQKAEPKNATGEDDDDEEWEDASDGEEDGEGSDLEHNSRGDEKKDTGREKAAKVKDDSPTSPPPRSRPTSAESPKDQRPPRPKVHIPPPAAVHDSPEGAKPLSPFFPLESHQPVSDWGEEMEMLSPRSSMGGESPLKPPSVESSPPQKKEEEERKEEEEDVGERKTEVEERKEEEEVVGERETEEEKEERKEEQQEEGERKKEEEEERKEEAAAAEIESKDVGSREPAEPQEEVDADVSCPLQRTEAQQTVILSEPEAVPIDSPVAPPSDAAPSEVSCPAHSEVTEASVTVDQNTPAAPPQEEQLDTPPSSAAPQDGDGSSEPEGEKDDDAAAAACTAKEVESSEQTSSG